MAGVCKMWNKRGTRCQEEQQNRTTVEKYEKNFKNSSERKKVRESQEETKKVSTHMVQDVQNVCRMNNNECMTCNNE